MALCLGCYLSLMVASSRLWQAWPKVVLGTYSIILPMYFVCAILGCDSTFLLHGKQLYAEGLSGRIN